jgi:sugar/nucleoside kinase (ribokinase family)
MQRRAGYELLILRAVELAKEAGLKVCLDLASYNIVEADLDFFVHLVSEHVDIVFANEEEARAFTGMQPAEALEHLHTLCDVAVVKLGAKGATIMRGHEKVFAEAMPVATVVDTTAAGDSFIGGLCSAFCDGKDIDDAVYYASATSSITIGRAGAAASIPTAEEVREFISKNKMVDRE